MPGKDAWGGHFFQRQQAVQWWLRAQSSESCGGTTCKRCPGCLGWRTSGILPPRSWSPGCRAGSCPSTDLPVLGEAFRNEIYWRPSTASLKQEEIKIICWHIYLLSTLPAVLKTPNWNICHVLSLTTWLNSCSNTKYNNNLNLLISQVLSSWYSAETLMGFQADLFLFHFSVFRVSRE